MPREQALQPRWWRQPRNPQTALNCEGRNTPRCVCLQVADIDGRARPTVQEQEAVEPGPSTAAAALQDGSLAAASAAGPQPLRVVQAQPAAAATTGRRGGDDAEKQRVQFHSG